MPKKIIETLDEFRDIVFNHEDYKEVQDNILDQGRWWTSHEVILEHIPTKTFWLTSYANASTENSGEFEDFNSPPFELYQVEEKEILVKKFVLVED